MVPSTTTERTVATIRRAFQKLKDTVRPDDVRLFEKTTLEDVRATAKSIERDQEQRRCLRNLRRIEPLFQALRKFGIALDVLCQGTPYLCFIWAPIKLLLTIADEYTSGFNKLVDAYDQIAKHLPRFERLESVFGDQVGFHSVLADVYEDILDFHRHAYRFLRRSGWKHLFDASWRSFDGHFNAILQKLERNQNLVDKEATSFNILESQAFRQRLVEDLEKREADRQQWQLRDTLAWLDLKGQDREQQELFERRLAARETDTCRWILTNPTIRLWLDPDDHRLFFWLRGKPGSGKTTLAAYLVEKAPRPPAARILYCLCSYGFGRSEGNPCSLVFRSLIAQVLRGQLDLLPHIYDNYVKIGAIPSLTKARELLKNLLDFSERVFLVLDGLDEFKGPDQKQVIQEITSLMKQRPDPDQPSWKVLVCSRETREIKCKLGRKPQISLSDEDRLVSQDIAVFAHKNLSELRDRFDDNLVKEIEDSVVTKANGMFLWVQLVLSTILEQESVHDLRAVVGHLPLGLHGVYKSILDRIQHQADEQQQIRARRILGWLSFTCRPLKVWEICSGIVFHDEAGNLNDETKLGKGILDICKPLIEERDQETVALVHISAREFLLHQNSGPYLSPFVAQAEIVTICARYLLTCTGFTTGTPSATTFGHVVKGFHDILPYVHEFWPEHLAKCVDYRDGSDDRIRKALVGQLDLLIATFSRPVASTDVEPGHYFSPIVPIAALGSESLALPQPVQKYLEYRKGTSSITTRSRIGSGSPSIQSDPTILADMYSCFRDAFEALINNRPPFPLVEMQVNDTDLEGFVHRHRSAAYFCGWSGCMWASTGFRTSVERADHEQSHKNRFRCSDPTCDFGIDGFASRGALRTHTLKYHTQEEDLVLPKFTLFGSNGNEAARLASQNNSIISLTASEKALADPGYTAKKYHERQSPPPSALKSYIDSTRMHMADAHVVPIHPSNTGCILWRKNIQYEFLRSIFEDKTAVFTRFKDGKQDCTFANIYECAMADIVRPLPSWTCNWGEGRNPVRSLAMTFLLVNTGWMRGTVHFDPSLTNMRYHPIPALVAHQSEMLPSVPEIRNTIISKTDYLVGYKASPIALLNSLAAPLSLYLIDLFSHRRYSSKSRSRAFLSLMWWYLESNFSKEDSLSNPFGPDSCPGDRARYVFEAGIQGGPLLEKITEEQADAENTDPLDEIALGLALQRIREQIVSRALDPKAAKSLLATEYGKKLRSLKKAQERQEEMDVFYKSLEDCKDQEGESRQGHQNPE